MTQTPPDAGTSAFGRSGAAERRLQPDYLTRFTPGRLVLVDSPHFMEPEIPGRIAREVRRVVAASGAG